MGIYLSGILSLFSVYLLQTPLAFADEGIPPGIESVVFVEEPEALQEIAENLPEGLNVFTTAPSAQKHLPGWSEALKPFGKFTLALPQQATSAAKGIAMQNYDFYKNTKGALYIISGYLGMSWYNWFVLADNVTQAQSWVAMTMSAIVSITIGANTDAWLKILSSGQKLWDKITKSTTNESSAFVKLATNFLYYAGFAALIQGVVNYDSFFTMETFRLWVSATLPAFLSSAPWEPVILGLRERGQFDDGQVTKAFWFKGIVITLLFLAASAGDGSFAGDVANWNLYGIAGVGFTLLANEKKDFIFKKWRGLKRKTKRLYYRGLRSCYNALTPNKLPGI